MGGCMSKNPARSKTKTIDRTLKKDKTFKGRVFRLLLLGPGESGKSTFKKQVEHLYGIDSDKSRSINAGTIALHTLESMKTLIEQSYQLKEENSECEMTKEHEELGYLVSGFDLQPVSPYLTEEVAITIEKLWNESEGIRATYDHRSKFQLTDNCHHFFGRAKEIAVAGKSFQPTYKDHLYVRIRTSGIQEVSYQIEGTNFSLIDVGGQRSERKKWINAFQDVDAILYVAAVSEFDQTCFENGSTNRIEEACDLFKQITEYECFEKTPTIVFLNKVDILKRKLERGVQVKDFIDGFDICENELQAVIERFTSIFKSLDERKDAKLFLYDTCAVDTGAVKTMFAVVNSIITTVALNNAGLDIGD